MAFQARDIQEYLRIPKIRYEYLARQIGIIPEIEEGEGTGRAHKYSFKNLMQFAIAERCSLNGFSLKQIKFLLQIVYRHADPEIFKQPDWSKNRKTMRIKDPSAVSKEEDITMQKEFEERDRASINFEIWFYGFPGGGLFFWEGKEVDVCVYNSLKKETNESQVDYYAWIQKLKTKPEALDLLRRAIKMDTEKAPLANVIKSFDACTHANIGKIRDTLSVSIRFRQLEIEE